MKKYTITAMREMVRFTPSGGSKTVLHISYTTPSGYTGAIELPKPEATEEAIHEKIQAEIKPFTELVGKSFEVK